MLPRITVSDNTLRLFCSDTCNCTSLLINKIIDQPCFMESHKFGLNSILLINRHTQQDKDIYGTGSDRKLKAYINHLLKNILTVLIYVTNL